jgi:hypothetical protein
VTTPATPIAPSLSIAAQRGAERVRVWFRDGAGVADVDGFEALTHDADVHAWLVETGWRSDGSSSSLDNIEGLRVGASGTAFNLLPATTHDRAYELSRRLGGLPGALRKRADQGYRDGCLAIVNGTLIGANRALGVARCHARYLGLRIGAWGSWRP